MKEPKDGEKKHPSKTRIPSWSGPKLIGNFLKYMFLQCQTNSINIKPMVKTDVYICGLHNLTNLDLRIKPIATDRVHIFSTVKHLDPKEYHHAFSPLLLFFSFSEGPTPAVASGGDSIKLAAIAAFKSSSSASNSI